jgi:hypothetical protein
MGERSSQCGNAHEVSVPLRCPSFRREASKIAHPFQWRESISKKRMSPGATTALRRFIRPAGTADNFRP